MVQTGIRINILNDNQLQCKYFSKIILSKFRKVSRFNENKHPGLNKCKNKSFCLFRSRDISVWPFWSGEISVGNNISLHLLHLFNDISLHLLHLLIKFVYKMIINRRNVTIAGVILITFEES